MRAMRKLKWTLHAAFDRNVPCIRATATAGIFLIRHAQNMNAAAQNALLKLLEEPPEYAFFILMTENESAILPTILSRCTQYAMVPLDTGCVMQLLRRQYPDKDSAVLQCAAAGCQGIAGDALAALSDEAEEMTQLAGEFLRALECRQELGLLQAAENCSGLSRQQFSPCADSAAHRAARCDFLRARHTVPAASGSVRTDTGGEPNAHRAPIARTV